MGPTGTNPAPGLPYRTPRPVDLRGARFGIEIETIGRTREQVAHALRSAVGGEVHQDHRGLDSWQVMDASGRPWKVVSDGSLVSVQEHLRAEIVSPILTYEDIPLLQQAIRAVRQRGARVDACCGIHIHVDATAFDGRTLANLAKIVYKQEPLILAALGVTARRQQTYSRPVSPEFIAKIERERPRSRDDLNALWYGFFYSRPPHRHVSRYHGVNLHNVWYRGTIEFRWFEGTLHAGKIKAYIQLVLAIAAHALSRHFASSRKRTFDPQSARYDLRVFLLRLRLIGAEFKVARTHLLEALPGDAAFKRGRPDHTASADSQQDRPSPTDADGASEPQPTPSDVTPSDEPARGSDAMHDESRPISIPARVFEGIEAVRRSGRTNMLDRPQVARLAKTFGYHEAATWLMTHRDEYGRGIFRGFVVDEQSGS